MTVYEYAARHFNEDPLSSGFTYGSVSGPDCLDTLDGDASYAEFVGAGGVGPSQVSCRLEPVGAAAPSQSTWTGITAAIAWKRTTGPSTGWGTVTHFSPDSGSTNIATFDLWGEPTPPTPSSTTADDYLLQWATVDLSDWPDALGPDTYYSITDTGSSLSGRTFRFTYFRVFIEAPGDIPLRLRQRGDGLGLGSVRVRGVGSQQRSVRVRGHL